MLGSALLRALAKQHYTRVVTSDHSFHYSDARSLDQWFSITRPDYVFIAGGKSGGIGANQKYPATLMLDNLQIATNIIPLAWQYQVRKLLFIGSSCSYPKHAPQPLQVESLLEGALEPTNEAYALSKLAGMKLCEAYQKEVGADFITGIPANDFGIGDEFSEENSHVIGALMRRMHVAKQLGSPQIEVWGSGHAQREFIYVDDLADASIFAMSHYSGAIPLNLGGGETVSIRQIAQMIRAVVEYEGELCFDTSKPDGMSLKSLDSSKLAALGWKPAVPLRDALYLTYDWFVKNAASK